MSATRFVSTFTDPRVGRMMPDTTLMSVLFPAPLCPITQLALHGVPSDAIADELSAIEAFAEIGDFIDAPTGTYSLGMRLRLAFSIYTRLKPDLFIIDEALGGGDLRFRNKFRAFLRSYVDGGGAILLCSHEMVAIQAFCHRCILLNKGRVIMSGPPVMMIDSYHELSRERARETAEKRAAGIAASDGDPARASDPALCVIESVGLDADETGDVRPGAPVVIEVVLAVSEEIDGAACGIEIGCGENPAIATLTVGYPDTPLTLRPPRMTLRCRIERLPLAPGNYDLRVYVSRPRANVAVAMNGYEDAATQFAVVAELTAVSNLARSRQNIVHIETDWRIVADEAQREPLNEPVRSSDSVTHTADGPAE